MHNKIEMQIRFGGSLEQEFCDFWNSEKDSESLKAEYRPAKKSAGGLAFALPPEVVIVLEKIGEGVLAAIGEGLGKMVWAKLKKYFADKDLAQIPKTIVILFKGRKKIIEPLKMKANPPDDFLEFFEDR